MELRASLETCAHDANLLLCKLCTALSWVCGLRSVCFRSVGARFPEPLQPELWSLPGYILRHPQHHPRLPWPWAAVHLPVLQQGREREGGTSTGTESWDSTGRCACYLI